MDVFTSRAIVLKTFFYITIALLPIPKWIPWLGPRIKKIRLGVFLFLNQERIRKAMLDKGYETLKVGERLIAEAEEEGIDQEQINAMKRKTNETRAMLDGWRKQQKG